MTKPTPENDARDIEFMFEMGNIRHIQRSWTRFGGVPFANLAEHHFRVLWIAMIIGTREGADLGKIAQLALVHDIAESRAGDVDYLSRQYVERHQEMAINDMLGDTILEERFLGLWREYEERVTLESQIVKDADNLDVDLELLEQSSNGHEALAVSKKKGRDIVEASKLYTDTARQLVKQIKQANVHDWHAKGRNRASHGDWKPS